MRSFNLNNKVFGIRLMQLVTGLTKYRFYFYVNVITISYLYQIKNKIEQGVFYYTLYKVGRYFNLL